MPFCSICNVEIEKGSICRKEFCRNFLKNCMDSPTFFFKNVLILRWKNGKPIYFTPMDWQQKVLDHIEICIKKKVPIRVCIQKGRRVGFSELMSGLMIWITLIRAMADKESKYADIISASHPQAKKLFRSTAMMVRYQPLLLEALKIESNGKPAIGKTGLNFATKDGRLEGEILALSSGGATKRGRTPSIQIFDEAAFIEDDDYYALDIASSSSDDHQIIGGNPSDNQGFFYEIMNPYQLKEYELGDEYAKFIVPLLELNDDGERLLSRGLQREITQDMIIKINGWGQTWEKLKKRMKYNYVKFMREVMGRFVGGSELFYPYELIRRCIRNIERIDLSKPIRPQLTRYGEIECIRIGTDMAKTVDATAELIWAETRSGVLHPIYWDDWRKKDYNDQYQRIANNVKPFLNEGFWVKNKVDSTGTQDANVDSIRARAGICDGVDFNLGNKQMMANKMYYLMANDRMFLPNHPEIIGQTGEVTADLKGADGHLGDWVAAMWAGIDDVILIRDAGQWDYGSNEKPRNKGSSLEVNSVLSDDYYTDRSIPDSSKNLIW